MAAQSQQDNGGTNELARISRQAGVSTGTVSRVFNNSPRIPVATRSRVMAAARELGFRPRVGVRSRQIALVTEAPGKSPMGGYVSSMTQYISYALATAGAGIALITEDRLEDISACWFDGIIGIAWENKTVDALRSIKNLPVVWLSENHRDFFHVVYSDGHKTGRMVGDYLRNKGHHRVAVIHDPDFTGNKRSEGLRAALEQDATAVVLAIANTQQLHLSVKQIIDNGCTAVWVTGVDMKVLEVNWLLQELAGKKVPDDISLIGFENPGISEFLRPSLTTVFSPLQDIAERAVALVLDDALQDSRQCIEIPEQLIERASVYERPPQH